MIRTLAAVIVSCSTIVPARCDPVRACPDYEPLLAELAPVAGWDVARMSRIMWRESRCDPNAYNARGRAAGLLQITPISYRYLAAELGEAVDRWTLTDPVLNVRAGAALFDYWINAGRSGYQPWIIRR